MEKQNSYELSEQKIHLLKEYVSTGEEILSNIDSWEVLEGILAQRDYLIRKIENLEKTIEESIFLHPSSKWQEDEIKRLVKLILDIDQSAVENIQKEQKKTLEELKANQQKKKFIDYEVPAPESQGRRMDIKK